MKKFIKTVYYKENNNIYKIDLYETDCYIIREETKITNEKYISKEKKDTNWFKYSYSKKCLDTEFNQELKDEFERQFEEYRKKIVYDLNISKAKAKVNDNLFMLRVKLTNGIDSFKGDWIELSKNTESKFNEIINDFNKFLEGK